MAFAPATSYIDDEEDQQTPNYVGASESPAPSLGTTPAPGNDSPDVSFTPPVTPTFPGISNGGRDTATPDDRRIFGTESTAPPKSPAEAAWGKVADLEAQRPERPKAGFWRTLASMGAGLGVGYVNAGGRVPWTPVAPVMNNIKYGGYNTKLADWQNKVNDAKGAAVSIEKGQESTNKQADDLARRGLEQAQADHARMLIQQANRTQKDRIVSMKDGRLYDSGTGQIIGEIGPEERLATAKKFGWDATDPVVKGWIADNKWAEPKPAPAPRNISNADYITGHDGRMYYIDPSDPEHPKPTGILGKKQSDPEDLLNKREQYTDERDKRREDQRTANELSSATRSEHVAYTQAEDKFAQSKRALDTQFDGQMDPHTKRKRPTTADPEYINRLQGLEDQLQKDKQNARDAAENTYAQHGQTVNHTQFPNPSTQRRANPGPAPSGGGAVTPQLKAYADKYFNGDVKKAQDAIAKQRQ